MGRRPVNRSQHKSYIARHRHQEITEVLQLNSVLDKSEDQGVFITAAIQNKTGSAKHILYPDYTPLFKSQTQYMQPLFDEANAKLGKPFDVKKHRHGQYARGVKLTREIETGTLSSSPQVNVYTGKPRRKPVHAGSSRDNAGSNAKWVPSISSQVQVDVDALTNALGTGDLTENERSAVRFIIEGSPDGFLTQTYTEALSGRQYADGTSLQNIPRAVRRLALGGYEVDAVNCHTHLMVILSMSNGFTPEALRHYCWNTGEIREQIAEEICIPVPGAKELLIAALYGSPIHGDLVRIATKWEGNPYLLRRCTVLNHIVSDARKARKAIISGSTNHRGNVVNVLGKEIVGARELQQLAHILQGLEALVLRFAVEGQDGVVSLEHDGWTQTGEPDLEGASERVKDKTGIDIKFKVK